MKADKRTLTGLCKMIFRKSSIQTFISILIIGTALTGCLETKTTWDEIYLHPSTNSIGFKYSGGEESFTISTNSPRTWRIIKSDASNWLSLSAYSGLGNSSVTVIAQANTDPTNQSAKITFDGEGILHPDTILVTMEARPYLTLPETPLTFINSGETQILDISSNVSWKIESSENWLSFSTLSGSNSAKVNVTALANTSTSERSTIITVKGDDGITKTINAKQPGVNALLTVSTQSMSFPYSAGNIGFSINSNTSWEVSVSSNATSWLSISASSGFNFGIIDVSVTANPSSQRTGTITVSGGGITRTISVTQAGVNALLTVSTQSMSFPSSAGDIPFQINSNTSWEVKVSSNATSWLSISTSSGAYVGIISVSVTANPSMSQRTGTITVSGGGITRIISVTQEGTCLTLSTSSLNFSSSAGQQSFDVNVTSGNGISLDTDGGNKWMTVVLYGGAGHGTVYVTVTANTSTSQRTATVTIGAVGGCGIERTVIVTQAGITSANN